MHIHTHLKKTVLLFTLAVFFAGQIAATPLKTGIPSLPEKSWYTRYKTRLMTVSAAVVISALGLVYYDYATSFPKELRDVVISVNSANSLDAWFSYRGTKFKIYKMDAGLSNTYGRFIDPVGYYWDVATRSIEYSGAQKANSSSIILKKIAQPSLLARLATDLMGLPSKISAWLPGSKSA